MKTEIHAQINMEQKLHLTMEMQLSLNVLQMSSIELNAFLHEEYMENPAVSLEECDLTPPEYEIQDGRAFLDYLNTPGCRKKVTFNETGVESQLEQIGTKESSKDELMSAVNCMRISEELKMVCKWILESLDERGYVTECDGSLAQRLRVPDALVSQAREIVKSLPPFGLGSKSIEDCLLSQLKNNGCLTEAHEYFINNHLENLAENRIRIIAKDMELGIDQVQQLVSDIIGLNPKPARAFTNSLEELPRPPDGFITVSNDMLEVMVNHQCIPRMRLDESSISLLKITEDKDVERYLSERVNRALLVMKYVEQRKDTLHLVIASIAEQQKEYFLMRTDFLRPLKRKDISEKLGLHESTVSRAVRDKYICTPRGTFMLSNLFDNQVGEMDGASSGKIKGEIQRLISVEDKKKPISDLKISEILTISGLSVKRRTIAKYREELGIRSSAKRKQIY